MTTNLPCRQVHFDFSVPPTVEHVAADFDPQRFADTLARAHVASVTLAARCGYGMLYYASEQFPERVHPHLHRNLLVEQIDACHKRGIRVVAYTSVRRDAYSAQHHPEWLGANCGSGRRPTNETTSGEIICLNSSYADFLAVHVQELLSLLPIDGILLDNAVATECCCDRCRAGLESQGADPSNSAARMNHAQTVLARLVRRLGALVNSESGERSFSFRPAPRYGSDPAVFLAVSHAEREYGSGEVDSSTRWLHGLGIPVAAHVTRFHMPGDWAGCRSRAGLEAVVRASISLGSAVIVDDRLGPSAQLDVRAYSLIGDTLAGVELMEPWLRATCAIAEVAIVGAGRQGLGTTSTSGAVRMLEEGGHQFDLIEPGSDFAPYRVLVLPDYVLVDDALAARLESYLAGGGSMVASFGSGAAPSRDRFALDALGVRLLAPLLVPRLNVPDSDFPAEMSHSHAHYIRPREDLRAGLDDCSYPMNQEGADIEALGPTAVLADRIAAMQGFEADRRVSARGAPPAEKVEGPAVVQSGSAIYFAHRIFQTYEISGAPWVKRLFMNALDRLLPDPLLRHDGPPSLKARLWEQPEQNRLVLHLLHYPPQRMKSGRGLVTDIVPLTDTRVSLKTARPVKRIAYRPQQFYTLDFWERNGRTEFVVPKINGHALIAVEFEPC